ncbi:tRNA (adenosine(37)-N6)-threonylcarbamoyltransferase complex ATPase subunit type 1 TsaE [Sphingomonas sp. SRS2]|uniref:tRNA (adenosine(37)-N6)-threonylcarbamoyltransferase complex ATPase subunit type 1 TsaE n=1 Tax=Sphingomonas sp. SRS2 TaxID=133190 RepID=UPI000618489C|nr:tRNA (adenosine(37)-N6)-threonylcarbamoyltransferase complex ATPase subunit type 1 TsaE [Sphingomonas sp. SRS2]KKC27567.1 ATPase [Sphingomonas sp. SRS2]
MGDALILPPSTSGDGPDGIHLTNPEATAAAGATLARLLRPGDVVALAGDLGAGKTTFARGLIAALGFADDVPSPSFPIVIPYAPPELSLPLWHVDLYRIDDPEEIEELGLDEARADAALLIEWPERMGARLWPDTLRLSIEREGDDARRLTWQAPTAWEGRWPPR